MHVMRGSNDVRVVRGETILCSCDERIITNKFIALIDPLHCLNYVDFLQDLAYAELVLEEVRLFGALCSFECPAHNAQ